MSLQATIKNKKVRVGDTLRVYQKIQEEGKTRTQAFEGIVIAIKGRETGKSFTVRKIASGVGVERIWPVESPSIDRISVLKHSNPRRSKLYYLRNRSGKQATTVKTAEKTEEGGPKETGSAG